MRISKLLLTIICFYFLILFQTSFLAHFDIFNIITHIGLVIVLILFFCRKEADMSSIVLAICAGLFLDIFSDKFIGFYVLILCVSIILINLILQKYVRAPQIKFFSKI